MNAEFSDVALEYRHKNLDLIATNAQEIKNKNVSIVIPLMIFVIAGSIALYFVIVSYEKKMDELRN